MKKFKFPKGILVKNDREVCYGDKMYINRYKEPPIFVGIFKGKLITSYGSFYIIQTKNSYHHLELYLPGVVKSEKEFSPEERKTLNLNKFLLLS